MAIWEELADRYARSYLARHPGYRSLRATWRVMTKLKRASFPLIRCYRSDGRYPQTVILDLRRGAEIAPFNERAMQRLLEQRRPSCHKKKTARELARFFILLRNQPNAVTLQRTRVKSRRGRLLIEGDYRRELPWSAAGANRKAMRRIETRSFRIVIQRGCQFRLAHDRLQ